MVHEELSFKGKLYGRYTTDKDRCCLKEFLSSSGGPPVRWSGTIYAIFKEGIMGGIHVKLFEIWTSVDQEEMLFQGKVYGRHTADKERSQ